MLSRLFALITILIATGSAYAAFTQRSAFFLRQENQPNHWPRHRTSVSGRYRSGVWVGTPSRQDYGSFRGGGPSTGK